MSTKTTPDALADIEARAGASDANRDLWLAERREGCTATEARDLYLRKLGLPAWSKPQELIDRKLGRIPEVDDLSHVPVIGWGRAREAVIADALRGVGIEPESRVFHHPENSRYLASPDGLGVDFDGDLIVSEIKTAKTNLPPGSPEIAAKGYEYQIAWVLFVTGATRCRYVVEERVQVAGGFVPGPLHEYWIERDEALIAELRSVVDEFLAELDRQRAEGGPVIDEAVDTHAVNYLRGLAAEKDGRALKETSYAALLAAGVSQESPLARVTYTAPKAGAVTSVPETDFEKAKRAKGGKALHSALQAATDALRDAQAAWDAHCERFTTPREVQGKGTAARVTVTAGKGTKA